MDHVDDDRALFRGDGDMMPFIIDGQTMSSLIRGHDWASSPIGRPADWPDALKLLVSIMLGSQQPMFVAWGPDHRMIYNDGYAEILADKHPEALGQRFLDVWHEIQDDLVPILGKAQSGQSVFMNNITLFMERKGFTEETHFSFSYTPVRNHAGEVAGIFCPCVETTRYVMAERHLRDREKEVSDALELQASLLQQKDMLLAEVNHRVKNSLQLVGSALSLQARRLTDPGAKAAFDQAITRVRAITSVHERLYKSDNPLVVDMRSYLRGLAEDLAAAPELSRRMQVEVDDVSLPTELAIPIALIVNELVTNALKYAYPPDKPGPIALSLKKLDDDMLELAVADEGSGMEQMPLSEGLGSKPVAAMTG